uniref:Kinesin-like protein n=1 Tax=Pseudo-nitzschia australis TaxID=44445 RepID=A0A7S4AHN6_9STRA
MANMDKSLWQDEAQLANMFLEEESNRSSTESSSPGFHFNSTVDLKRNLTATFDQELSNISVIDNVNHLDSSKHTTLSCAVRREGQPPPSRPPLPARAERDKARISKKKVAVYLRIRPLPLYVSSSKRNNNAGSKEKYASTIEVLEPSCKLSNQTAFPTTIRTYPPNISNAYKVNINRNARDNSAYAKEFYFDRVMGPETSQENVYSAVAGPIIQDLLDARDKHTTSSKISRESALLFSYGITNAGKTHTVLGDINSTNQSNWGIIPRAISDVFHRSRICSAPSSIISSVNPSLKDSNQQSPCDLYISFFEIYNENVYDLMPSNKSKSSKHLNELLPSLKVRECRRQIFIRGLAKHKIDTVEHGITLVKDAHNKRHTSSNNLNSDSSRSHFVCQMQIVPLRQPAASFPIRNFSAETNMDKKLSNADSMGGYSTDDEAMAHSKLAASTIWIVDLAGNERSKRTRVGRTRQKESTKINNSLMTLMRCLNAMKDNGKRGHGKNVMPFRDSKLTHIFMGHLTSISAARTAMMVNVNPSVEDFDETQHVLAYSRKAKLIEMSMEEYGHKRKQVFGEEYDQNGRKKIKREENQDPHVTGASNKSKNTLLSRMVKKLSPKKKLQTNIANIKMKDENTTLSTTCNYTKEIERLKICLQVTEEQRIKLENENAQLLDELDRKEDLIRAEVASEMEERLRETRTKHNEKYEQFRSVMHLQSSKTDISVSMSRAGNQIEELMDKIDECEKEMFRMSQAHRKEITVLMDTIEEQKEIAVKVKVEDTLKISNLKQALKKRYDDMMHLKGGQTSDDSTERPEGNNVKDVTDKGAKFKKKLRPRKAFGNATNQSVSSRVFDVKID